MRQILNDLNHPAIWMVLFLFVVCVGFTKYALWHNARIDEEEAKQAKGKK